MTPTVITSNDILAAWGRIPADTTTFWNTKTDVRIDTSTIFQQCCLYPTMTWSTDWRLLDAKDNLICSIRDIFDEDTLKFDLSVLDPAPGTLSQVHRCEPAAVPLQRFDATGGGDWYFYCKDLKCGRWMYRLEKEKK